MTISQVPSYSGAVPLRSGQSPSAFSANVGDMLTYLLTYVPALNITVEDINEEAENISLLAIATEASAFISAANSNFKGNYSSLSGSLAVPASVKYTDDKIYLLLVDLADVTSVVPGTDANTWYDYTSAVSGGTVVSSATDTTAGRLTNTGWNYGRAAFGIAPVDQSANGSFNIDSALPIYGTNYLVDRTVNAGTFPAAITGASNLSIIREELLNTGATVQKMYPYTDTTAQAAVAATHTRYRTTTPAGVSAWVSSVPVGSTQQFMRLAHGGGSATYGGGGFTSATDVDTLYNMDWTTLAVGDMLEIVYDCEMSATGSGNIPTIGVKLGTVSFTQIPTATVGLTTALSLVRFTCKIYRINSTDIRVTQDNMVLVSAANPRGANHVNLTTSSVTLTGSSDIIIRASSPSSSRTLTRHMFSIDHIKAP